MKRFALGIALVLAMPLAAFAHSICTACPPYGNSDNAPAGNYFSGGTLTGTDAGLTLTGSNLTVVHGITGADLGTVSIAVGPLLTGSLQGGGTFSDAGSSFSVAVNPNVLGGKLRGGGILFSGTFVSPITWTPVPGDPGIYFLQGVAFGYWSNGSAGQAFIGLDATGSVNSNGVFTSTFVGGQAFINPEPGTLGLFVTGLLGMGVAIRRKIKL
jgi:hypothetical protein